MSKTLRDKITLLPRHAKGLAVVHLIKECMEHPAVFVFGELLMLPNVQSLADQPDGQSWLRLLKVFAFGLYEDYVREKDSLPPLSPQMLSKLRSLTIISLAEKSKRIPYQTLLTQLELTSRRELEDLIIEVIYAKALDGKMDQKNEWLEVESTIGRDIQPPELDSIAAVLTAWCDNCDNVLSCIESEIAVANSLKQENVNKKQELDAQLAKTRASVKAAANNELEEESLMSTPPGQRSDCFLKKGTRSRKPKTGSQVSSQCDFIK